MGNERRTCPRAEVSGRIIATCLSPRVVSFRSHQHDSLRVLLERSHGYGNTLRHYPCARLDLLSNSGVDKELVPE